MIKPGRPPMWEKPLNKNVFFKASQEFLDILEEAKWDLRMNNSEILREAIKEYLTKHLSKEAQKKLKDLMSEAPEWNVSRQGT